MITHGIQEKKQSEKHLRKYSHEHRRPYAIHAWHEAVRDCEAVRRIQTAYRPDRSPEMEYQLTSIEEIRESRKPHDHKKGCITTIPFRIKEGELR